MATNVKGQLLNLIVKKVFIIVILNQFVVDAP